MKPIAFFSFFFIFFTNVFAQENFSVWPVLGKNIGENILFRPNDNIAGETNYADLIIFAEENTPIVSPVTGYVTSFHYTYRKKYNSSIWLGVTPSSDYFSDCNEILKYYPDKNFDPKFISITIGIKISDGRIIYISGIRPEKSFKTGEKISQGEIVGKAGYFYYKINEPSIAISISKNGNGEDPMLPFGLKSTFKKFEKKEITNLTKTETLEDIHVLVEAIEEGYPGLFDYFSLEEWKKMILNIKDQISDNMSFSDFYTLLKTSIVNQIKDNHFIFKSFPPLNINDEHYNANVIFGFLNDSLVITNSKITHNAYFGKKIIEVNGITTDSIKQLVMNNIGKNDGYIQSYIDLNLLAWTWVILDQITHNYKHEYLIKFSEDNTVFFPTVNESKNRNICVPYKCNWQNFFFHNTDSLTLINFEDSISYMGIHSFFLTEVEIDKIATFIKQTQGSSCKHIIIDLRNNSGGDERVCAKLFSFFAQQPFLMQEYSQVKKKKDFKFFRYCTNYNEDVSDLFMEYEPIPSKEGFFLMNRDTIYPDLDINFNGNLYLITNEHSFSASTVFAGLVHKYRRGVIVGRETGNTYHQMNATKFAQLLLPNSQIEISIPLVKTVFDNQEGKIPYGRGVLPHYPVNFSLDELGSINGDTMMNYTFQLIHDGKYFIEEEFIQVSENKSKSTIKLYLTIVASVCVLGLLIFITKRKR